MLKNNYHTHMKYCNHAKGMVIDYVQMAFSLNMEELGMTDHAPVLDDFLSSLDYDRNYGSDNMKLEQVDDYLNQIEECKRLYPNLKIYSGFESEFLEDYEDFYRFLRNKVDYMIFSTSLGAFLPLSDCEEGYVEVPVTNPFDTQNLITQFQSKIGAVVSNGYDVFDSGSPFYNDVCSPFTMKMEMMFY